MAKIRRNHSKTRSSSSFLIRGIVITTILCGALIFTFSKLFYKPNEKQNYQKEKSNDKYPQSNESFNIGFEDDIEKVLPKDEFSATVHHKYYSLGYNEKMEQANWTAYQLTKKSLQVPNVKRERYFNPDYAVETRSAFFRDYKNSGYTKGHLVPAGDMAFNKEAMKETFYMSNVSPQTEEFNGGIWNDLEKNVRNWAYNKRAIYVITGPVFTEKKLKRIGENRVAVPNAFYKIILSESKPIESIAFLIPHNNQKQQNLKNYITSIDDIEAQTQIDFFADYFDSQSIEGEIEKSIVPNSWPIDMNLKY